MPSLEVDEVQLQNEKEEENEEDGRRIEDCKSSASSLDTCKVSNGCISRDIEIDIDAGCCSKIEDATALKELDAEDETGDEEEEAGNDDDNLPIDKGWAWVALAGIFLNVAVMVGFTRGLSILFIEYLRVFNASTAKTTLLMGVNSGVYSISALLSMHILVSKVGVRKTLFIGAAISVAGMATAIAPISIDFLIGVHSVLLGIGNSMVFGPGVLIVGHYFKKRHGFASALAMSGVSFGGGVFPPLIRYLLDEYGLQGTMTILTGLSMNMFVGAATCIPLDTFRKKRKTTTSAPNSKECRKRVNDDEKVEQFARMNSSSSGQKSPAYLNVESPFILQKRIRTESNGSSLARSTRNMLLYASHPDFGSVISMVDAHPIQVEEIKPEKTTRKPCVGFRSILSALDFTLFKNPMFLLVVSYSFFNVHISLNGAYLPALASEKGVSQNDAALFLTVLGAIDFVFRLFVGVIVDKGFISVNRFMAIGLVVLGTASHFTHFYNSYGAVLGFSVVIGMSTCTYFALIPVAIVKFMGLEYMGKTLGFVSLFHGVAIAIANPILGGIRDATGSYTGAYNFIGVCTYLGAALLFCEPLIRKYAEKNKRNSSAVVVECKPLRKEKELNEED